MTGAGDPPPHVRSDLHLQVDGLQASILADGQHLTLITNDAGRLMARARSASAQVGPTSSLRQACVRVLRTVEDAGLSVRVVGERGLLLEAGRGCGSRTSGLVLAGNRITLGRARPLAPDVLAYLVSTAQPRGRVVGTAGGLAIATLFIVAGVRRRSSAGRRRS